MQYLSVCAGIEAASVAWHHMGWTPAAFSEIEQFPSAVLAHHYPNTPNWGDMTKFKEWPDANIDVLVGGTPCQSFSVAGLRAGLADPRGNLMLTFGAIADKYRPKWLVWENVPGVLSSNGGRDFGTFLGMLGQLGYGFSYRVLDAQYFGVAQRRRRVFVVGCLGDWRRAAAVLFEQHSLSGHPAPSRKTRQDVANCLGASPASSGSPNVGNGQGNIVGTLTARMGNNPMGAPEVDGGMYLPWPAQVAPTLNAAFGSKQGLEDQHALGGAGLFVPSIAPHAFDARQSDVVQYGDMTGPLDTYGNTVAVAIQDVRAVEKAQNWRGWNDDGSAYTVDTHATQGVAVAFGVGEQPDVGYCLRSGASKADKHESTTYVGQGAAMQVRRLTPTECERLQGFSDGYTAIPYRNKPASECPDGPRYKALGNSMAVPVMRWIGERIRKYD